MDGTICFADAGMTGVRAVLAFVFALRATRAGGDGGVPSRQDGKRRLG
jgi:hypothetical protein